MALLVLDLYRGMLWDDFPPDVGNPAPSPEIHLAQACSLPLYLCEDEVVRRPVLLPFSIWILGAVFSPRDVAMLYIS
jgi:hypothetical protein